MKAAGLDAIFILAVPGSNLARGASLSSALRVPLIRLPGERCDDAGPEIARKRNLALETARTRQWRRVMLLDDDITVTPAQVRDALELLRDYPAAGFRATDFPDHSTLVHALRAAGGAVGPVCTGGGSLLLDMSYPHGLFPPVYNEDLLFLHPLACQGGVADAGEVRQDPYDPFTVSRARTQEFGDLLYDGLVRAGADIARANEAFWEEQIILRRRVAESVLDRTPQLPAVRRVVLESIRELDAITARRAASFVMNWGMISGLYRGDGGRTRIRTWVD